MHTVQRPPWSRTHLKWYKFEEIGPNKWILNLLPPFYASVFEQVEPDLMSKSQTGWQESHTGRTAWAIFNGLSNDDITRVEKFTTEYERFVLLGLNRNTEQHFADELDVCLALDYNFEGGHYGDYTEIGQLVYHAKYRKSIAAAEELGRRMAEAVTRLPLADFDGPLCLSYVPASRRKRYDLPRIITGLMIDDKSCRPRLRDHNPLVEPDLRTSKPDFKRLTVGEKIRLWEKILARGVVLSGPVAGAGVIVIDDLYQSGATMWSCARFLKSCGASHVYGLVCEKSCSDRDNR